MMASTSMPRTLAAAVYSPAARRAFGSAVGFCMGLAVVVSTAGWLGAPALLRVLATPAEAYDMALVYLRVIFIAMPATLLSVMMMMGLRGVGDAFRDALAAPLAEPVPSWGDAVPSLRELDQLAMKAGEIVQKPIPPT